MIVSQDRQDIFQTIESVNDTYRHSLRNFLELSSMQIQEHPSLFELPMRILMNINNFLSSVLIIDNFYAFTYDSSLLDLTLDELKARPDVRLKYLQVDSMNKCVPQDWFLGYDQFAVYTFLQLAGQQPGKAGFLTTFIRKDFLVPYINSL